MKPKFSLLQMTTEKQIAQASIQPIPFDHSDILVWTTIKKSHRKAEYKIIGSFIPRILYKKKDQSEVVVR